MAFWNKKKDQADISLFDGKRLRYVTERDSATGVECVVGRQGLLSVTADKRVEIICDGSIIFRGHLDRCNVAELMSKDGSVIKGYDSDKEKERTIVAYYRYHRKV